MAETCLAGITEKEETITLNQVPLVKTDDCAVISILSSGVCGTDPHIFSGKRVGATYPTIQGHEICGRIEHLGKSFSCKPGDHIAIGDRVILVPGKACGTCHYCITYPHQEHLCVNRGIYGVTLRCDRPPYLIGGFAQKVVITSGYWLFLLPKDIPDEIGCLTEPLAVAIHAVERGVGMNMPTAQYGPGLYPTIIIQGAGPIGLLTAITCRSIGAHVIITDILEHRVSFAKELKLHAVLLPRKEGRVLALRKETKGIGADIAIDCAGTPEAFEEGIQMVRRGGRYIELGNFADSGEALVKPSYICRNDLEIFGSVIASPWDFGRAIQLLQKDAALFQKLITHRFRIEEKEKAIINVKEKHGIKTIIVP